MRSKEVKKAIEEGKDYIEFMTTAGENAEWTEKVLNYIEELENARSPYFIPKAIIQIKIEEYNRKILELYKKDFWVEPDYTILKLKYENYIEVLKELLGE